ncbi:MAG TPA: adenosine deaminase [Thermoflexia bacterium]|nr:adenosine deaminase [Thermoflexia bacterium]
MTASTLIEWARALPKIDLHRHLEGSLRLHTLSDIAQEHGIDLPSYDIEELRPYVQVTDGPHDFHHFLAKFKLLRHFYTSKEAVTRIASEAVLDAAQDNIRYLELRFNPVALARAQHFQLHEVVEWVMAAVAETQAQCQTRTCLLLQIGRDEPLRIAEEIIELAIAYHGPLIRGIDLAGDETLYPARRFVKPFDRARQAGLAITIHAGEADGANSVRDAIKLLGAQRIGHGISTVENSEVVQLLRERNIALEVCPTSNFQTGVVHGLTLHPLLDLFSLRLNATINTDDPSISDTTLSAEYVVAIKAIGLHKRMIYQALHNAVEAAFIPEAERGNLRAEFQAALGPRPEIDMARLPNSKPRYPFYSQFRERPTGEVR